MSQVADAGSVRAADPPQTAQEVLPLVYEELRKLAAVRLAREPGTHTLQPTALVHEAWLRLARSEVPAMQNRAYFFAAAAEAMRRIMVERARSKQTLKRGRKPERVDLNHVDIAIWENDDLLLRVDEALELLAATDRRSAELVKLRFFAGLSYSEAARILGISERSAKRYWTFARAWLYRELSEPGDAQAKPASEIVHSDGSGLQPRVLPTFAEPC